MADAVQAGAADPLEADLERGRQALARHDWQPAFETLSAALAAGPGSGEDLERLAEAAWFSGHGDASIEAQERAYRAYEVAGDAIRAASVALDLAREYALKRKFSIASAWSRRAERLLDGRPETYAHSALALTHSQEALATGDLDEALRLAGEAVDIARRVGHPDLQAIALATLGSIKIATGAAHDGLSTIEDAAFSAANGELSPLASGMALCCVIAAYRDLTDYTRAAEWTEVADRWCQREAVGGFPGVCRIHRAEVAALGGAWDRARQELERATVELQSFNAQPPLADGHYALGELRLRTGDLEGATAALAEAESLGRSPQPARALVLLAEGKAKAAAAAIGLAVEETWDTWSKTRLLPAQVEIAIAVGDVTTARAALEAFTELIQAYSAPALAARAQELRGRVLLAEGSAPEAATELRRAIRGWREVGAPYDVARGHLQLGQSLLAMGHEDAAELEIQAALAGFDRLGAALDTAAASAVLESISTRRAAPTQQRRTFMFTDIVGSTNLAELLGNAAWQRLLDWHDTTLRTQFSRHGGQIVNSTGDGFFVAFDTTRQALGSAIDVQRALADHRRASGFAPSVRIGLHAAEATRRGDDYSGMGVHVAARVAAEAAADEIAATSDTLAGLDQPTTSSRTVTLKGVSTPVRLVTVDWA